MSIPGECQLDCSSVSVDAANATAVPFATTEMNGGWTQRAYQMSWDGKYILVNKFDGIQVVGGGPGARNYTVPMKPGYRYVQWGPDNKKFLFWANNGIAVADVTKLGEPGCDLAFDVIYTAPKDRQPSNVGWSPTGNSVYVLEQYREAASPGADKKAPQKAVSSIKRVPATGGAAAEIHKHSSTINWFMPPIQRFEDGSGPKPGPYQIAFGAQDGVFVMNQNGGNVTKIADISPNSQDVIWAKDKEKFALLFRQAGRTAQGESLQGLYLVHADQKPIKKDKGDDLLESLDPALDIHTIYFSDKGRYLLWSSGGGVSFREVIVKDPGKTPPVKIDLKERLEVHGCHFDHEETRVAIAAGNRVYVYDLAKKTVNLVAKSGDESKSFTAEPHWRGNEIVFSTFTNIAAKRHRAPPKPRSDLTPPSDVKPPK